MKINVETVEIGDDRASLVALGELIGKAEHQGIAAVLKGLLTELYLTKGSSDLAEIGLFIYGQVEAGDEERVLRVNGPHCEHDVTAAGENRNPGSSGGTGERVFVCSCPVCTRPWSETQDLLRWERELHGGAS